MTTPMYETPPLQIIPRNLPPPRAPVKTPIGDKPPHTYPIEVPFFEPRPVKLRSTTHQVCLDCGIPSEIYGRHRCTTCGALDWGTACIAIERFKEKLKLLKANNSSCL